MTRPYRVRVKDSIFVICAEHRNEAILKCFRRYGMPESIIEA